MSGIRGAGKNKGYFPGPSTRVKARSDRQVVVKIPREGRVLITRGGNPGQPKGRGGRVIGNWGQCQRWTVEAAIGVRILREKGQSGSERFGDGGVLVHM